MCPSLYDDEKECAMHLSAIRSYAEASNIPENEIKQIYEAELEKLKAVARVKDFLLPLIDHRVKDIIRHLRAIAT